ncbi:hypothetical protein KIPB_002911 [Kipferlia bialata]|uniref:Uncharacterized protein n=1 Tax=Kipferlia bialata TaxID=797122 RepID=A0A9K3CT61_9EUKA|nr:hypothetical protein KIPB_002911 [Kipferlia bialata]|eukprot:g2911.t1
MHVYHCASDTWLEPISCTMPKNVSCMYGVGQLCDVDSVLLETNGGRLLLSLPDPLLRGLGGEYLQQTATQLRVHPAVVVYRMAQRLGSSGGILEGSGVTGLDETLCILAVEVAEVVGEMRASPSEDAGDTVERLTQLLSGGVVGAPLTTTGQAVSSQTVAAAYLLGALRAAHARTRETDTHSHTVPRSVAWTVYVVGVVARWETELVRGLGSCSQPLSIPDCVSLCTLTDLVSSMSGPESDRYESPSTLSRLGMLSVMATACVTLPLYTPLWMHICDTHGSVTAATSDGLLDLTGVDVSGERQGETMNRLLAVLHSQDAGDILTKCTVQVAFHPSTPTVVRDVIHAAMIPKTPETFSSDPEVTIEGYQPNAPVISEMKTEYVGTKFHLRGISVEKWPLVEFPVVVRGQEVLMEFANWRHMIPISHDETLCVGGRTFIGTGVWHREQEGKRSYKHSWEPVPCDDTSNVDIRLFRQVTASSLTPVTIGHRVFFCAMVDYTIRVVYLDLVTRVWSEVATQDRDTRTPRIRSIAYLGEIHGCLCIIGRVRDVTEVWACDVSSIMPNMPNMPTWTCLSSGLPTVPRQKADIDSVHPQLHPETGMCLPYRVHLSDSVYGEEWRVYTLDEGLRVGSTGPILTTCRSTAVHQHVVGVFCVPDSNMLYSDDRTVRVCLYDRCSDLWVPLATLTFTCCYATRPPHLIPLVEGRVLVVQDGLCFEVDYSEAVVDRWDI